MQFTTANSRLGICEVGLLIVMRGCGGQRIEIAADSSARSAHLLSGVTCDVIYDVVRRTACETGREIYSLE